MSNFTRVPRALRALAALTLVASATLVFATAGPAVAASSTCKSITNGTVCVAPVTVNGNPNYMEAWYTVSSSGHSVTGHVELGGSGSTCTHGGAYANSATRNLAPGQTITAVYGPRNFSTNWAGTFWAGSGSSFTDYGTVCALY
jgi:hypothetical protein